MELTLHQILKKLLLVIIGSGLLSNAFYILGLAYYEGYIEGMGFNYNLFPIDWNDTLLWTYSASRELGVSTINIWTTLTGPAILVILITVYALARIWMSLSESSKNEKPKEPRKTRRLFKILIASRRAHPKTFKVLYPPLKWLHILLITEQSLWAFVASYFFLIVIFFLPILIFIWVYFPMLGVNFGRDVANKRLAEYKITLCGNRTNYWNKCIKLPTEQIKDATLPKIIEGRLILKNDELIGVLTATGPITISMPSTYYHQTTENACYEKDCGNPKK